MDVNFGLEISFTRRRLPNSGIHSKFTHGYMCYCIYIYTRSLDLKVRPSAPPPERPIFKIPFDSENLGKFMTSDEELSLISAF